MIWLGLYLGGAVASSMDYIGSMCAESAWHALAVGLLWPARAAVAIWWMVRP